MATAAFIGNGAPANQTDHLTGDERVSLNRLILNAFLVRLALAMALHVSGYSRVLAPDEQTYVEDGWVIALYWLGDLLTVPWRYSTGTPVGYFQINGLFFALFGHTEVPIKIVNALVGALVVRYVYLLGRRLYGQSAARRAAVLTAYFPSLILWSAVNIRDVWMILLLTYAAWRGAKLQANGRTRDVLLYAVAVLAVSRLRDYMVYLLLIPPVIGPLIARRGSLGRNFILAAVASVVGLLLIQQGIVGERTESRLSLEAIALARQNMATGGSAFVPTATITTPAGALLFLPIGLTYFFFSPFPWQITSVLKALALPEMLFLYYLVPSIARGLARAVRERFRESVQMLLLTALIATSYALGSGNVGTMYRHRAQTLPFLLILAGAGATKDRIKASGPPTVG